MIIVEGTLVKKNSTQYELSGNGKTHTFNTLSTPIFIPGVTTCVRSTCGKAFYVAKVHNCICFSRNTEEILIVDDANSIIQSVFDKRPTVTASLLDNGIKFLCSDYTYQIVWFKDIKNTLINTVLRTSLGLRVEIEYAEDIIVTTHFGSYILTNTPHEFLSLLYKAVQYTEAKNFAQISMFDTKVGIGCILEGGMYILALSKEEVSFLQRGFNVTIDTDNFNEYVGSITLSLSGDVLRISYGANAINIFVSATELRGYCEAK